jgi:uncharacterized protein
MAKSGDIRQAAPSPWCEARESRVHGCGVFAVRDIPAGTRIIEYAGEVITKREAEKRGAEQVGRAARDGDAAVYIFILNRRHDIDGNFPWNTARLINHSCSPNCETEICGHERIWVVALRDIAAGEELFFDYRFDLESFEDHPCRCGSPECFGYILNRELWDKARRKIAAKARRLKRRG